MNDQENIDIRPTFARRLTRTERTLSSAKVLLYSIFRPLQVIASNVQDRIDFNRLYCANIVAGFLSEKFRKESEDFFTFHEAGHATVDHILGIRSGGWDTKYQWYNPLKGAVHYGLVSDRNAVEESCPPLTVIHNLAGHAAGFEHTQDREMLNCELEKTFPNDDVDMPIHYAKRRIKALGLLQHGSSECYIEEMAVRIVRHWVSALSEFMREQCPDLLQAVVAVRDLMRDKPIVDENADELITQALARKGIDQKKILKLRRALAEFDLDKSIRELFHIDALPTDDVNSQMNRLLNRSFISSSAQSELPSKA